jgi:hypothetical protein
MSMSSTKRAGFSVVEIQGFPRLASITTDGRSGTHSWRRPHYYSDRNAKHLRGGTD